MIPSVIPDVHEGDEHQLKEAAEDQAKGTSEKTLPDQAADRTKRQAEQPEAPQSREK